MSQFRNVDVQRSKREFLKTETTFSFGSIQSELFVNS